MDEIILVVTHLPDRESARRMADALIESQAAACVNLLPECTSVYRWKGEVETAAEIPLLMKTSRSAYPRLENIVRRLHPYELPEIIVVPIIMGLPDYMRWVDEETQLPDPAKNGSKPEV